MKLKARVLAFSGIVVLAGCAADAGSEDPSGTDDIKSGTAATAYPEAVLVDSSVENCSGAVIARRIVLTAGHCVAGDDDFTVTVPSLGGKRVSGSKKWTDYRPTGEDVNPATSDVAVIVLDRAIDLPFYPSLSAAAVADGTQAVNIGRVRNGDVSTSRLYAGAPVALGRSPSFPLDYQTNAVIEPGDSGGPVYVGTGPSRQIVAVNSGAGRTVEVLARVDLVRAKVLALIAQNP